MDNSAGRIFLLLFLITCHSSAASSQVDRRMLEIDEKGTKFAQEIEIDEERNVEVFRVPAHNDVVGADFYNDFKMRVTVTRVLSQKVCYVSKMDPSMSSPGKLKADLTRAASHPGQLPVNTHQKLVVVTGPANRRLLTKYTLEFCGTLPIYNTKVFNNPTYENGTATVRTTRRRRRQSRFNVAEFKSCLASVSEGEQHPLHYVTEGNCLDEQWDLRCQIRNLPRNCYYYVTCQNNGQTWPALNQDWTCSTAHRGAYNAYCCDYTCPPDTEE